jgi:AcrR family transcriptional regulator
MSVKLAREPFRVRLRQEVIGLAERIVTSEGLPALQARRVAGDAGCSVGTVYNVFGDLDGLIIAVNERTLDLLGEPLTSAFEKNAKHPTAGRLTALALAYMQFAIANQLRWRAVFEHRLPAAREVPEHYRANQARLLSLIEETIAREIPDKDKRSHAARALFAAVHGIIALALDNRMSPFDAGTVEAEIRFIVRAAAAGLADA